jgi:hypothetical protein
VEIRDASFQGNTYLQETHISVASQQQVSHGQKHSPCVLENGSCMAQEIKCATVVLGDYERIVA